MLKYVGKQLNLEEKSALGLAGLVILYGLYSGPHIQSRRKAIMKAEKRRLGDKKNIDFYWNCFNLEFTCKAVQKVPIGSSTVVDHPLTSWILQNSKVVSYAIILEKIRRYRKLDEAKTIWEGLMLDMPVRLTLEALYILLNFVDVHIIHSHIPFFTIQSINLKESATNLVTCGIWASLIAYLYDIRERLSNVSTPTRFRPLMFLLKLFIFRCTYDFVFFVIHYAMHKIRQIYIKIHKFHHEHVKTRLDSNAKFTVLDYLLESYIPFHIALKSLRVLNFSISEFEKSLMFGYTFQILTLSHAAKAIPTFSAYAPLSPLLTKYDDLNAWHHERHHNLFTYNFGITAWCDMAAGTLKH